MYSLSEYGFYFHFETWLFFVVRGYSQQWWIVMNKRSAWEESFIDFLPFFQLSAREKLQTIKVGCVMNASRSVDYMLCFHWNEKVAAVTQRCVAISGVVTARLRRCYDPFIAVNLLTDFIINASFPAVFLYATL